MVRHPPSLASPDTGLTQSLELAWRVAVSSRARARLVARAPQCSSTTTRLQAGVKQPHRCTGRAAGVVMFVSRSALAVAVCSLLGLPFTPSSAFAQLTAAAAGSAEQIVVTATRQPTRIDAQLSDVTLLQREDIERAEGHSLTELLAQQAGIQLQSNGGFGQASGLSIRGTDVRHIVLIIDGVRYGSATLGQPVFENLPLEDVERIEIVRGPLSSLYGADAAGGVIQIFTRRGAAGFHPDASVSAGTHRALQASAGASWGSGDWSGALRAQHLQTQSFSATNPHVPFGSYDPDTDPFRQGSATGSVQWRINSDWQWHAQALHSEGVVHYDDGPGVDTRAALKTETLETDLSGRVMPAWQSTLRIGQTTDQYDTLASSFGPGTYRTRQNQLSWENSLATPVGSLLALAETLKQDVHKTGDEYAVHERTIDALALGLDGSAGAHHWQLSVRRDRNSQFGAQNTGNLAYAYDLSAAWRAGFAVGSSFVAPSFNQLYFRDFGTDYGNPNLQPERGHSRELSLRWRPAAEQELQLVAFSNRVRDYIATTNQNVPRALIDGATLSYQGRLDDWDLQASLDQLNPRDSSGQPLPRRARHSLKGSADRRFGDWSFGATLVANSRRGDTDYDANFNPVPVVLSPYATLDLRADWRLAREWTLQTRLNNAGGRAYETAYGYNQPGRELVVTLRWAPR
jgi:vitamin B12 transporter